MEYIAFLKLVFLPFLIALTSVCIIHPYIVKIALLKKIVDNPNARKLQKEPVPVMGGVAVFFGIFVSTSLTPILGESLGLMVLLCALMIMLYLGAMDDILGLGVVSRVVVQVGTALMLILIGHNHYLIDNFMGLAGINELPFIIAIALSVFITVAIINATNLIDGVDGLSSGFGVMASVLFLCAFIYMRDHTMIILCSATIGAMLIFFLHNVFGLRSKMFIGDGGSLVLGTILAAYSLRLIHYTPTLSTEALINAPASVIPFTIAVLSIPVFDTLRVMGTRIWKQKSPFHPDKTHLHHLFIELGFSHVMTTTCVLSLNMLIVGIWSATYFLGFPPLLQLIIVIIAGVTFTYGLFYNVKRYKRNAPKQFAAIVERIHKRQPRRDGWILTMQKLIDKI